MASIRRMIARDIVVFPQPDSPTSPTVSPSEIESVTSFTACTRATSRSTMKPCLIGKNTLRCSMSMRGEPLLGSRGIDPGGLRRQPDLSRPHLTQLLLLL